MLYRGRPLAGRPQILASALAALLVVVGSGTVLAETSDVPAPPPKPRVQHPGDVAGYRLPFHPGLDVYIHQGWHGTYSHTKHAEYAYDFGLHLNTPVLAAASGVVSFLRSGNRACGGKKFKHKANFVTIDHPDGSSTHYGHLSTISVRVGDVVEVGQEIARSGMTGWTGCQAHLHFARQLRGDDGITQSIPVYFEEVPGRQLRFGETIRTAPACSGATKGQSDKDVGKKRDEGSKEGAKMHDGPLIGGLCATYRDLDTEAVLFSRLEDQIDYNWAEKSPGGYWLDDAPNGFAASWTGQFTIDEPGVYALQVRASDRVRIRIDSVTLVDVWTDFARPRNALVAWRATEGKHTIEVEHVDQSGHGSLHLGLTPQLIDGAWVRQEQARGLIRRR